MNNIIHHDLQAHWKSGSIFWIRLARNAKGFQWTKINVWMKVILVWNCWYKFKKNTEILLFTACLSLFVKLLHKTYKTHSVDDPTPSVNSFTDDVGTQLLRAILFSINVVSIIPLSFTCYSLSENFSSKHFGSTSIGLRCVLFSVWRTYMRLHSDRQYGIRGTNQTKLKSWKHFVIKNTII